MIRRGEVWWASMPDPSGSGSGCRRPVLVVQADEFNESRIQTVVVAAVTSNLRLGAAPGNVLCRRRDTGLRKDSVVNVSQLLTLDRSFLSQRVKALPASVMRSVEAGLRLVLGSLAIPLSLLPVSPRTAHAIRGSRDYLAGHRR